VLDKSTEGAPKCDQQYVGELFRAFADHRGLSGMSDQLKS